MGSGSVDLLWHSGENHVISSIQVNLIRRELQGLLVFETKVFGDARSFFSERDAKALRLREMRPERLFP
jgi:hypothetical protein